jgi:acyl-CoA thioesterase
MNDDVVRARAEAMWAEDRASLGLGMRLDEIAPGRARLSMMVTEAMANGHGICHGGFIFALADSAMAFVVNPRGELHSSGTGWGRAGRRCNGANACRSLWYL